MAGTAGSATGESDHRVVCKLKRDFEDFMDLVLLVCIASWRMLCLLPVIHYTVALNELSHVLSTIHDSDLRCIANCFLWLSVSIHLV
jgi:hypothetical protein